MEHNNENRQQSIDYVLLAAIADRWGIGHTRTLKLPTTMQAGQDIHALWHDRTRLLDELTRLRAVEAEAVKLMRGARNAGFDGPLVKAYPAIAAAAAKAAQQEVK